MEIQEDEEQSQNSDDNDITIPNIKISKCGRQIKQPTWMKDYVNSDEEHETLYINSIPSNNEPNNYLEPLNGSEQEKMERSNVRRIFKFI